MGDPVSHRRPLLGRVTSFDSDRALGTVTADEGTEFGFHAVAIADGSRDIEVGSRVTFLVRAGHRGLLEARGLVVVTPV
jgi:cold shock CspA family protein